MASVSRPASCANADGWRVVFSGAAVCVMERSFTQWGLLALMSARNESDVRLLRKSVGLLQGIKQPRHNFSASHFERMASSLTDYASELALGVENAPGFADGELSFGALAQQFAPPRDITEVSLGSDVVKARKCPPSNPSRHACGRTPSSDFLPGSQCG